MSEFKIHHHAAELLKLFDITEGDGPEVYAEILTKDLTPYVTTQVSSHSAKRKIAEVSPNAQEFSQKYEDLKSKNIRELDSFVYLLSNIVQEQNIVRFIERNEKSRAKQRERVVDIKKPQTQIGNRFSHEIHSQSSNDTKRRSRFENETSKYHSAVFTKYHGRFSQSIA